MGFGGAELPKLAKNKKLSRKINGNLQTFENFHELWKYFLFKKLILIIIKVRLVGYLESLTILKEIKKPRGEFLPFEPKAN